MINKEGWEKKKLGVIAKASYGYTEKAYLEEIGPKFLRITDIQDNGVNWDTVPYCKISSADLVKFKLENGDIVFARTGATTGKCFLLYNPPISVFASYLIRVKVINDNLSPNFLFKYFQSNAYWSKINSGISGSTQGGFNATKLSDLDVPIPPRAIQHQIVSELDTLSDIITKKKQQLVDIDALAQATFYDMFGDLHSNLKRFEIKTLNEIFSLITDGTHQTPTYTTDSENGYKFLSSKDVVGGYINWSKIKYIPEMLHNQLYKRLSPQRNDILLAKNGTTGVCALVDNDEIFDIYVSLALLRPKPNFNAKFLVSCINSLDTKRQFNSHLKGIGVPNLHLSEIKKTRVLAPPLALQTQFATKIQIIEKQKELINQSIADVQQLFDYTMDKYFN